MKGSFTTCHSGKLQLQPWTKPVETNRENAYFFLSSRQKLKPPPNECPIPPSPYPKLFRIAWHLYTLGFQTKTTLNRGWGGGLLFVFRGDGSRAQKLENRWNCLNSFVRGCSMYQPKSHFNQHEIQFLMSRFDYSSFVF